MSNNYFHFKQFSIFQDRCAMKVSTDGVLLGAWVSVPENGVILDVGTGTGLIALMIAQRMDCIIDAIEIDYEASEQARENILISPWKERINVTNISLKDFATNLNKKYDLIVCNPPFYISNLKSVNEKKNLARNSDSLPLAELIELSCTMLNETGTLAVIIPYQQKKRVDILFNKNQLEKTRETCVRPNERKSPVRVLIEAARKPYTQLEETDITIMNTTDNRYTEDYKNLVRNFYLNI